MKMTERSEMTEMKLYRIKQDCRSAFWGTFELLVKGSPLLFLSDEDPYKELSGGHEWALYLLPSGVVEWVMTENVEEWPA
jgi:hypothetical protein